MDPLLDGVPRLVRLDALRPVRRQRLAELLVVLQLDASRPDAVGSIGDEVDDSVDENVDADVGDGRRHRHRRRRQRLVADEVELVAGQLGGRFLGLLLRVVLRRVSLKRER